MLYNKFRTIEDTFSDAAKDTIDGRNVNWHVILVSCGLIDMDKSSKFNTVCVKPNGKYHYDDLKQKIEWLRPYYRVDPLITTVINNMDDILKYPVI